MGSSSKRDGLFVYFIDLLIGLPSGTLREVGGDVIVFLVWVLKSIGGRGRGSAVVMVMMVRGVWHGVGVVVVGVARRGGGGGTTGRWTTRERKQHPALLCEGAGAV